MNNSPIKTRNIYYMLAYAFQALHQNGFMSCGAEELENARELFAEIISKGLMNQIKRGINRDYVAMLEELPSPRGKIDVAETVKKLSLQNRRIFCRFDEFSEDSYANRVLKVTALLLLRSNISKKRKSALSEILRYFREIGDIDPQRIAWRNVKIQQNGSSYKTLLNICRFVIEGMLQADGDGCRIANYIDDQKIHTLYERFILNYYREHFPELTPASVFIDWDIGGDENQQYLPRMKSDVILKSGCKSLIIDAKYYSKSMQENYGKMTIHSGNLYQIYAYVKNFDDKKTGDVAGMLLYAKTDEEITPDDEFIIGGNKISAKTLDLNAENFEEIKKQLNSIAENFVNKT